jgi:pyridoxal phosphate enzyme (YggS family)
MNHESVNKLTLIKSEINKKILSLNLNDYFPNIIAVSKTFPLHIIEPLIQNGHTHFGENKVQEALTKWDRIKQKNKELKLHMLGKLQTNKVKFAVGFFDYLHSVDNIKLAEKIANEQQKNNLKPKIFLQINIGNEEQKSGVSLKNLKELYELSVKDFNLNVIGLMCLPPENKDPKEYFSKTKQLNDELKLDQLSMGMSSDYLKAIEFKSTYLRIGSKIFGERN